MILYFISTEKLFTFVVAITHGTQNEQTEHKMSVEKMHPTLSMGLEKFGKKL